ncbi:hypothetical protein GUITHDRAFT_118000 [Guillardia theta CCMP2712]|uniref:Uncharacterized protein n=1 Tax=Guillardia theta (strain CCMP2712) TaxID=905079 RepID=L1IHY3_GUITC|nr:hypothetical protein GUITHDRAFT_118000 [Guillardia theta CCMP2712]EKX35853.1 hypothetical protein GUITHDRAFT_118000 [Guillardia theta CCMP2712]|eukprot:XP_005822833.1 hypothetical protein GUITHDRAFT_118000 [Guillardia theta CCMP2712]
MSENVRPALQALDHNKPASEPIAKRSNHAKEDESVTKKLEDMSSEKEFLSNKLNEVLDDYEELRKAYDELHEHNKQLKVELINTAEESSEWKNSYESLQTEGSELFKTYERKCTMLKQVTAQLEEQKSTMQEKENRMNAMQQELRDSQADRDDLRAKVKAQSELLNRQESEYLELKSEYNQLLEKLELLEGESRGLARPASSGPAESSSRLENERIEFAVHKSMEEIVKLEEIVKKLWASNWNQGGCVDNRSTENFSVFKTPSRTPGRNLHKTPSRVIAEIEQLSPSALQERAESLIIRNDLLRQELDASKREREERKEYAQSCEIALQERIKDLDEERRRSDALSDKLELLSKELRALQLENDSMKQQVKNLEEAGHAAGMAVQQELEAAKQHLSEAEEVKRLHENSMASLKKQLDEQILATKNAENDMRIMYKRHKKEMQEMSDKFKAGDYEERYKEAVQKASQLETLVSKWVTYARQVVEMRTLQAQQVDQLEVNSRDMLEIVEQAKAIKLEAEAKVAKWSRQTRRMQRDMTKLVRMKTRALEERKELHDKYLELVEELQAQGEYAQQLEENEQKMIAKFRAEMEEVEEKLREKHAAEMKEELSRLREEAAEREEELKMMLTAAEEERDGLAQSVEELEARAAQQEVQQALAATLDKVEAEAALAQLEKKETELGELRARVIELEEATKQNDLVFSDTMAAMQAKEDRCRELEEEAAKQEAELKKLQTAMEDAEAFNDSERSATQEALDELTKSLAQAQEQVEAAQEQVEEAERKEMAAKMAAACGIVRLTRVAVEVAGEEEETDMIDPELRQHWREDSYEQQLAETKTSHELRALLVGLACSVESLLTSFSSRRDELKEQVAKLLEEEERRSQQLQDSEARASLLQEEVTELRRTQEECMKTIDALEKSQKDLEEEVEAKSREWMQLKEEAEALRTEAESSSMQLATVSEERQKLQEENEKLRPERDSLRAELEDSNIRRGQAEAAEERMREKAEKKLAALRHNLQRSEEECASLDAILAHVRAVLHMYIDSPQNLDSLKRLLHRISPEDTEEEN